VFKVAESATEEEVKRMNHYEYPGMSKTMGSFHLTVQKGQFSDSEILVLLGENGTGKTTFIRMLAGKLEPDEGPGEFLIYIIFFYRQRTLNVLTNVSMSVMVRNLLHTTVCHFPSTC
jgi:translation initiation factor RLI1